MGVLGGGGGVLGFLGFVGFWGVLGEFWGGFGAVLGVFWGYKGRLLAIFATPTLPFVFIESGPRLLGKDPPIAFTRDIKPTATCVGGAKPHLAPTSEGGAGMQVGTHKESGGVWGVQIGAYQGKEAACCFLLREPA